MTVSCAGEKKRVYKKSILKGKHTINIVKKSRNDPYLSKRQLQHPFNFTAKEIFSEMAFLKYNDFTIMGKDRYIFNRKLARHLSPYFVNAFKKAGKNDIVRFDIHLSHRQIIGDMFIYRGKLHLRFNFIHGIPYESDDEYNPSENWMIVLRKGQKYQKISGLFGLLKKASKNWVILPLKAASVKDAGAKTHKPAEDMDEMKAKFTRLKFLLDNGIITKEEYDIKKKELMEKYF